MKVYGYVVVIKRAGGDYTSYPLTTKRCIIGKNNDCDIRIQLPSVSKLHCKIEVDDAGKAYITNLNRNNSTLLNDVKIPSEQPIDLYHNDVIIIADRKFRWEYSEVTKYSYHMHKQSNETVQLSASQKDVGKAIENFKRVSFGPYLSPEQFDLKLPPSTPVRKGEKPDVDDDTPRMSLKKNLPRLSTLSLATVPENDLTPSKSLLKRRSPTPIKPSLAKSLGIFPKTPQMNIGKNSPPNISEQKTSQTSKGSSNKKRKRSQTPENPSKRLRESNTPLKGEVTPKDVKPPDSGKKSLKKSRSFADVVKSSKGSVSSAPVIKPSMQQFSKTKKLKKKSYPQDSFTMERTRSKNFGINSTGHANSPAPIIIHKKLAKTPKTYRKGKKIQIESKMNSPNLEGVDILFKSPSVLSSSPETSKVKSLKKKSTTLPSEILTKKRRTSDSPISSSRKSLPNKQTRFPKVLKHSKSESILHLSTSLSKSPTVSKSLLSPKRKNKSPRISTSYKFNKLSRLSLSTSKLKNSSKGENSFKRLSEPPRVAISKSAKDPVSRKSLTKSSSSRVSQSPKASSPRNSARLSRASQSPKASINSPKSPRTPQSPKVSFSPRGSIKSSRASLSPKVSCSPRVIKSSGELVSSRLSKGSKASLSPRSLKISLKTVSNITTPKLSKAAVDSQSPKRFSNSPRSMASPKAFIKSEDIITTTSELSKASRTLQSPKRSNSPGEGKSPRVSLSPKSSRLSKASRVSQSLKRLSNSPGFVKSRVSFSPRNSRLSTKSRASHSPDLAKSPKVTFSPNSSRLSKVSRTSLSSKKLSSPSRTAKSLRTSRSPKSLEQSSKIAPSRPEESKVSEPPKRLSKSSVVTKSPRVSVSPKSIIRLPKSSGVSHSLKKSRKTTLSPRGTEKSPKTSYPSRLSEPSRTSQFPNISSNSLKKSTSKKLLKSSIDVQMQNTPDLPIVSSSRRSSRSEISHSFKQSAMSPSAVVSKINRSLSSSQSSSKSLENVQSTNHQPKWRSRKSMKVLGTSSNKLVAPRKIKSMGTYNSPRSEDSALKYMGSEVNISLRDQKSSTSNTSKDFVSPDTSSSSSHNFSMISPATPLPVTPPSGRKSRSSMRSSNTVTPITPASKLSSSVKSKWKRGTANSSAIESITDFSTVGTPDITMDRFISPVESPTPTRMYPESISRIDYLSAWKLLNIPVDADFTTYEFNSHETPNISKEKFVSPIGSAQRLTSTSGLKQVRNTPLKDCNMTKSIQKLFASEQNPDPSQIRKLFENSNAESGTPKENVCTTDYQNLSGIEKLLKTPQIHSPPLASYSDFTGLKKMLRTPRMQQEPACDYTNVHGLKKLLKTPKPQSRTPPADYTTVHGVKRLMRTPRVERNSPKADYTNVFGLKRLMNLQKEKEKCQPTSIYNLEGLRELMKSPKYKELSKDAEEIRLLPSESMPNMHNLGDLKTLSLSANTPFNSPDYNSSDQSKIECGSAQPEGKSKRKYSKSPSSLHQKLPASELKNVASDEDLTPRRKRGRPPKTVSSKKNLKSDTEGTPIKDGGVDTQSKITTSSIKKSELLITPTTPRRRGRPAKLKDTEGTPIKDGGVDTQSKITTSSSIKKSELLITPTTPRRRGRPAKQTPSSSSLLNKKSATDSVADASSGKGTKKSESEATPLRSYRGIREKLNLSIKNELDSTPKKNKLNLSKSASTKKDTEISDVESTPSTSDKRKRLSLSSKKIVQELNAKSTPDSVKRGRPPKRSTPIEKLVQDSNNESVPAKTSRSRKPRALISQSVQESDTGSTYATRRKGRTTKDVQSTDQESDAGSSLAKRSNRRTQKNVQESDGEPAKATRRGRQVKPIPSHSAKTSDVESTPDKNSAGKRHKNISSVEKLNDESAEIATPKRGRGKPKQLPSFDKILDSPIVSQDTSSDAQKAKRKLEASEDSSSEVISPRKTRATRTRAAAVAATSSKSSIKSPVKRSRKRAVSFEVKDDETEKPETPKKRKTRATKKSPSSEVKEAEAKKSVTPKRKTRATKKSTESPKSPSIELPKRTTRKKAVAVASPAKKTVETKKTRAKKASPPKTPPKRVTRARAKK